MAEFVDMDYAEVEALWTRQRTVTRSKLSSQLTDLQLGVPIRLETNAKLDGPKAFAYIQNQVRSAMKKLGYDGWRDVMVIIHEGRVVVCRPFGKMPKRPAPTLREIDRREEHVG